MTVLSLLADLHGVELDLLTLLIGAIVATMQRRYTGINPGGLISGAFVILTAALSPYLTISMLLVGYMIASIYKRYFSHIFSGREPMFYMAMMSVLSMLILNTIWRHSGFISNGAVNYLPGLIVPAIVANAIVKQGAIKTYFHLGIVTILTLMVLLVVYGIGLDVGHNFYGLDSYAGYRQTFDAYSGAYMAIASIAIGYIIYKKKRIKFAGYVILPFLATLLITSPLDFALVMSLVVIAYLLTLLVRRSSLVVGIGRYAFVLVTSILLVWTSAVVLLHETASSSPFLGAVIFASLAVAVIVNDATIFGLKRSVPALAIGLAVSSLLLVVVHATPTVAHKLAGIRHGGSAAVAYRKR